MRKPELRVSLVQATALNKKKKKKNQSLLRQNRGFVIEEGSNDGAFIPDVLFEVFGVII